MTVIIGTPHDQAPVLDYCRTHQPWLLELDRSARRDRIADATTRPPSIAAAPTLAARLEQLGGARQRDAPGTRRAITCARRFGSGSRQILLLGHFDTVWPIGPARAHAAQCAKDGLLHGPGVFDMKAGIALAMLATRAVLDAAPLGDVGIVMLWTTDEEIGSDTRAR